MFFQNSAVYAYLEQPEPIFTLKNISSWKCSFPKRTQFSDGNYLLDAAVSYTDGFLWRDSYVSSTQLNRRIWNQQSVTQTYNESFMKHFCKNELNSQRETMD
jgi:hypothetical protein